MNENYLLIDAIKCKQWICFFFRELLKEELQLLDELENKNLIVWHLEIVYSIFSEMNEIDVTYVLNFILDNSKLTLTNNFHLDLTSNIKKIGFL